MTLRSHMYFCYPRSKARKDLLFIDMEQMEQLPLFGVPVLVTFRVWDRCVRVPRWASPGVSEKGHVWDLLAFLARSVIDPRFTGPETPFTFPVRNRVPGRVEERARLKAVLYVDDDRTRSLVVMFADEDSAQAKPRAVHGGPLYGVLAE